MFGLRLDFVIMKVGNFGPVFATLSVSKAVTC